MGSRFVDNTKHVDNDGFVWCHKDREVSEVRSGVDANLISAKFRATNCKIYPNHRKLLILYHTPWTTRDSSQENNRKEAKPFIIFFLYSLDCVCFGIWFKSRCLAKASITIPIITMAPPSPVLPFIFKKQ